MRWCFVLCRTNPEAPKHKGLSYLLVPMRQKGVEVRPIRQLTGTSEFNEVFFDGARTPADHVVGEIDGGWQVAMATLAFERGASTLGQQLGFENELREVVEAARANGASRDPTIRQRLAQAWIELRIMRVHALRTLGLAGEGNRFHESSSGKADSIVAREASTSRPGGATARPSGLPAVAEPVAVIAVAAVKPPDGIVGPANSRMLPLAGPVDWVTKA